MPIDADVRRGYHGNPAPSSGFNVGSLRDTKRPTTWEPLTFQLGDNFRIAVSPRGGGDVSSATQRRNDQILNDSAMQLLLENNDNLYSGLSTGPAAPPQKQMPTISDGGGIFDPLPGAPITVASILEQLPPWARTEEVIGLVQKEVEARNKAALSGVQGAAARDMIDEQYPDNPAAARYAGLFPDQALGVGDNINAVGDDRRAEDLMKLNRAALSKYLVDSEGFTKDAAGQVANMDNIAKQAVLQRHFANQGGRRATSAAGRKQELAASLTPEQRADLEAYRVGQGRGLKLTPEMRESLGGTPALRQTGKQSVSHLKEGIKIADDGTVKFPTVDDGEKAMIKQLVARGIISDPDGAHFDFAGSRSSTAPVAEAHRNIWSEATENWMPEILAEKLLAQSDQWKKDRVDSATMDARFQNFQNSVGESLHELVYEEMQAILAKRRNSR